MNKKRYCTQTEYNRDDNSDDYDELGGYPECSEWENVDKITDAWYFGIDIGIDPRNHYADEALSNELKKYNKYISELRYW